MSTTRQDVSLLPPQSDVVHPQGQHSPRPCSCACGTGACQSGKKRSPKRPVGMPPGQDPYRWRLSGFTAMVALTIPAALFIALGMGPGAPTTGWEDQAIRLGVPASSIARGEHVYGRTCVACHGADGKGIARLGKPLRNSAFVQGATDDELVELVVRGRAVDDPLNTTHSPMPPRAGFDTLTRLEIRDVVAYMRALQEPGAEFASTDAWIIPVEELQVAASAGVGGEAFVTACSACHGPSGQGVEGSGVALRDNEFIKQNSETDLIAFIKRGRASWDADSKTGIDMPPKGGNPALSDATLAEIVTFIKAMQEGS